MHRNGFSLVELMIAIALMALFAGAVIVTVSPGGASASDSAGRFASRVAAARDESIMTGRPVSAWVSASGYGFDQLGARHWQTLTEKPFQSVDWDKGTTVSFPVGDHGRARIRFDTLGMPEQPLTVRVAAGGRSSDVRVAATGDISVEPVQ